MKKNMRQQSGFAATSAVIILLVFIIIGGVAWYVLKANKTAKTTDASSTTTSKSATTTQPAVKDPYAGWKKFCSEAEKSCFQYPSDWTVKTEPDEEFAPGSSKITSPSGTVVNWTPAISGVGGACDPATDPMVYLNEVTVLPHVSDLYFVQIGNDPAVTRGYAVMTLPAAKAKVGNTGDCIIFGFFKSKNSTFNGVKGDSSFQVDVTKASTADKDTAKKILLSYTYDI